MKPAERFRIYAKLLYLYPHNYRKQYGEQLLQTVADMVDDAPSTSVRLSIWLRICFDLPTTICKENLQVLGDFMGTKKNQATNNSLFISGTLIVFPVVLLAANHVLMLSGPGRGVFTHSPIFIIVTTLFPALAVIASGFSLYAGLRASTSKRQILLSAVICMTSLALLTLFAYDNILFYKFSY